MLADGWMLLDPNDERWADYEHPAFYNMALHQALDMSEGDKVGDWIIMSDSSGDSHGTTDGTGDSPAEDSDVSGDIAFYNTVTHETRTADEMLADLSLIHI